MLLQFGWVDAAQFLDALLKRVYLVGKVSSMRVKSRTFAISATAVLISTICVVALYWYSGQRQSILGLDAAYNWKVSRAVTCRASLFWQKAQGEISELSWTELWALTVPGKGFNCNDGGSPEASLRYSSTASEEDRTAGARFFRQRCTACHGVNGSGGPGAPSLRRSGYNHGDSDLAIFEILRHGVPGTAMPSVGLPTRELLKVIAYLRVLQAQSSGDHPAVASHLDIQVSSERLRAAGADTAEWLTYSGSYRGWRHTSLAQITPANVAHMRIRWIKQFDINDSNIEATPLVVNGVIFMTADAGHVLALNAKTGDLIWEYKRPIPPNLPLEYGPANRGLAVHGSTLFLGGLDGYLVAINANDGNVLWQTSVANPSDGYSITAAPLVVNHSVIVGISGGEFRVRGFVAAYDISTGERQWRFDTIPGPGEVGHQTWENDAWRTGGGATWITGSYDPSSDLLYWGVGNPSPAFLGDARPGDNLFTASVIALHASTGKLAWYFQFTPHDEHDRDAAQTPILADLSIGGMVRKAICWPNRNGFYYVLDRSSGEFLVGVPFVKIDWAKGLSSAGRPILTDAGKISTVGRNTRPGINGGTNWQNSAFDPKRSVVFVPAVESSSVFTKTTSDRAMPGPNGIFVGSGWSQTAPATNEVLALDAATGKRIWAYTSPSGSYGGLLSTDGGLVLGAAGGVFFALDANSGREVWRTPLGGNTKSAPISFTVDGQQVIALAAGRALFVFGL